MSKIPTYNISLDPNDFDGQERLGMRKVAYVSEPAIITKGLAFDAKQLTFKDELLYRVAAPALIPDMPIYRFDEELGEYNVMFSKQVIEQLRSDFMLNKEQFAFNLDHDSNQNVPAYILDSWITGPSATDPSYTKYGIQLPEGSWFVVTQFTDKEFFVNEIINKDRAAYSIEGFLGMSLSNIKQKLNKQKMEKQTYEMAKLLDGTQVWISKLEVDGEVFTIDASMEKTPILDGPYELADGTKIVVACGKITELIPVAAPVEAPVEAAVEAPVVEAPVVEAPVVDAESVLDEAAILAIVQPKLDELIAAIAELKTKIEVANTPIVETVMNKITEPISLSRIFKR